MPPSNFLDMYSIENNQQRFHEASEEVKEKSYKTERKPLCLPEEYKG